MQFCENCGMKLVTDEEIILPPKTVSTKSHGVFCPECQTENRAGVRFCENCGHEFAPIRKGKQKGKGAALQNAPKASRPRRRRRILGWVGSVLRKPIVHRPLIAALIIFSVFFTIGILTTQEGPAPIIEQRAIPLVTWEGVQAGERITSPGKPLSATAWDDAGVARVEVYVDGKIVSAKNNVQGGTDTSFSYPIPLGNIGQGNHEVFTRVYGADGDAGQSSIVFIDGATFGGSQSSALPAEIEPATQGPSAPIGVSATATQSGDVRVRWEPVPNAGEYRVYGRFPGSSSLILIGEVSAGSTEFSFPVDREGAWEVFVAGVDYTGKEGSLGHATHEVKGRSGSVEVSSGTLPAAKLDLRVPSGVDRVYAYVRIGGGTNRYQRVPEAGFLSPSLDGRVVADIPALGWPSDVPLDLEFELWGWQGSSLTFLGSSLVTIPPERWATGSVEFQGESISAVITLQGTTSAGREINPPPTAKSGQPLPPPVNIRFAMSADECELVASELGKIRSLLRQTCKAAQMLTGVSGIRSFFLWDWPELGPNSAFVTENDITGFEIRFVITENATQTVISERISSISAPEIRGWALDINEIRQTLRCDYRRTWYIRAVGTNRVSDWVYVSSIAPTCDEYPPTNGCGGQSDGSPDLVPDLIFETACNAHDKCYVYEWSHKNKVECDNEFWWDMQSICTTSLEGALAALGGAATPLGPAACLETAHVYYEAVNISGRSFYEGSTSVTDCFTEPAINPVTCSLAYTPEGIELIGQGSKAVWNFSVTTTKTGWKYTKEGFVYVGNKTVDLLSAAWDKIPSINFDW